MRLAAIYVENHEYLFDGPQTINFGGQYIYAFEKKNDDITIKRRKNEKFIPQFFELTKTQSRVTNLNAIVGQNGAGKSTVLDIIRSEFIEHSLALPRSKSLFLIETDDTYPLIERNDFNKIYLLESGTNQSDKVVLENHLTSTIQTIYYSPHFDYKYNPKFDNYDSHDISFDKIVEKDLKYLHYKDTDENGWPYSPSQELLFKNAMRQIAFLSSPIARRQIFDDLFELQGHYEPILHFRGYEIRDREWNTPYQLRTILKNIEEKLDKEVSEWHNIRVTKDDKVLNQVEINQYILKRNVLRCLISLLYRQMERRNSFLQEGFFPYEELKEQVDAGDAYETFLLFIKHSGIQWQSDKPVNVFSERVMIF